MCHFGLDACSKWVHYHTSGGHDMRIPVAVTVLVFLCGCASSSHDSLRLLRAASETEFGSAGYACVDTVAVAAQAGIDYGSVLEGCLRRRERSMHTLFWLSEHGGFDAASSQGHATVLGMLLRRLGDDFFGGCLADEPEEVRSAVHSYLLYDFGWGNTAITIDELKSYYPLSFAGCTEQD